MSLVEIGLVVLPVFGLIGLGFALARLGVLDDAVGNGLGDFVYVLAIPVLVFRTVGTAHFPDASPWPLWAAYFTGVVVAWALGTLVATRLFGRSRAEGVIAGTSASFSNLVMVGTPLILSAFGEAGAVWLFIVLSVHLPTMMVAGTLMTERAVRLDRGEAGGLDVGPVLLRVAKNLVSNPLVIALALGAAWRGAGIPLTGIPRSIIDQISAASIPCSLVSLGMGLKRYGIFGEARLASVLVAIKLLVMPAVVWAVARYGFRLEPLPTAVLTIAAGCSAGINAYLFAVRFDVAHRTASNAVGLSTMMCVLTQVVWFDWVARMG